RRPASAEACPPYKTRCRRDARQWPAHNVVWGGPIWVPCVQKRDRAESRRRAPSARLTLIAFLSMAFSRIVGGQNHCMRAKRVRQTGQRHLASCRDRVEKGLKLVLIRMIRNIARIEQLHG